MNGYLALGLMLAIYVGARLVTGSLAEILLETLFGTIVLVVARIIMARWLQGIGAIIFCHGIYDAFLGPHTGVAEWYPPLCAGFDFFVGIGLILVLRNKLSTAEAD